MRFIKEMKAYSSLFLCFVPWSCLGISIIKRNSKETQIKQKENMIERQDMTQREKTRRMHYESMLMPGGSFMSSMDSVIDEQVHKVETQWKKLGPANHIVLWGWSCLSLGILCRVDQPIEHSLSYFFFLGSANAQWKEGLGKRLHSRGQGIWRRLWPCFTFDSMHSLALETFPLHWSTFRESPSLTTQSWIKDLSIDQRANKEREVNY